MKAPVTLTHYGAADRDILTHGLRCGWLMLAGERFPVRTEIQLVGGYSARAGQLDQLRFLTGVVKMPAEIRVVHGDAEAKETPEWEPEAVGARNVMSPLAQGTKRPVGVRRSEPRKRPSMGITRYVDNVWR